MWVVVVADDGADAWAIRGVDAPGHARSVVGEAETSVGSEQDDAAVAAEAAMKVSDGIRSNLLGRDTREDAISSPLAEDKLHDGFAPAGEGDGGAGIIRIAAATDERRIADPARSFVEGATRGSGGGEIAVDVDGDGADGVVSGVVSGEGAVRRAGGLASLGFGEALAFAGQDELGVVDEGQAVGRGKFFSALGDEVDVVALVEDEASGLDGVADALNTGDAAGAESSAVHEQGVELNTAVASEEAPAAGVEGGIVFHRSDSGFDRVDGGRTAFEQAPAFLEGVEDTLFVSFELVGGDIPGAAVDEEDWRTSHKKGIVAGGKGCLPGAGFFVSSS